jgi:hypothetical protein
MPLYPPGPNSPTGGAGGADGGASPDTTTQVGGKTSPGNNLETLHVDDSGNAFTNIQTTAGGAITATGTALDVNVASGITLDVDLDNANDSVLAYGFDGVDNQKLSVDTGGKLNVNSISGTVSLPTGAATEAKQDTGNTSLSSVDTKTPALGQATMAGSSPVVISSNQSTVPVSTVSEGATGASVPASAQLVGAKDGVGDFQPLLVDSSGRLEVTGETADNAIFGQSVASSRTSQISASFIYPIAKLNLTQAASGSGSISQSGSEGRISTGTSGTGDASIQTNTTITYKPGREVYAVFSARFTTPTHANSFQRCGIYDNNDGFWFGYNGLDFGVGVRKGGVDTFTPQASFNTDIVSGQVGSLFCRLGVCEPLDQAKGNVYRIRYGWLGYSATIFEVLNPDGDWVVAHRHFSTNSSTSPVTATPNLPVRFSVDTTGADATDLVLATSCMDAGIVAFGGVGGFRSGNVAALSGEVNIPTADKAVAQVNISGTWSGTLIFEGGNGDGDWNTLRAVNASTGVPLPGSTTTTNASVIVDVSARSVMRVRASLWSSGTAVVTIGVTSSMPFVLTSYGVVTTTPPVYSSGTLQSLSLDTTGNLRVTPSSSGAQSPGTVSSGEAFAKRAFVTQVKTTLTNLNTEQNMMLLRNPDISTKTLYIRNISFTSLTSGKSCIVTVYQNPTLSATANVATNVTFQGGADTVTITSHGRLADDMVRFATIVTTTGIVINTQYYVRNPTANTFQVAATPGGAVIDLISDGTGTMYNTGPSTVPTSMFIGGGAPAPLAKTTSAPWTGTMTSHVGATSPANSRGVVVSIAGDTNEQSFIDYDWGLLLAAGNSILITGIPAANNTDFVANIIWSEVNT